MWFMRALARGQCYKCSNGCIAARLRTVTIDALTLVREGVDM